jgi:hypothetical protein
LKGEITGMDSETLINMFDRLIKVGEKLNEGLKEVNTRCDSHGIQIYNLMQKIDAISQDSD